MIDGIPEEGSVWLTRDETAQRKVAWIVEVMPSLYREDGHLVRFQVSSPQEADVRDAEIEDFLRNYMSEEDAWARDHASAVGSSGGEACG
jgi:hypothetical protein